ncbi:putative leucine rich repeat N-terminal domain protein [Trypoxylus dichotomus]
MALTSRAILGDQISEIEDQGKLDIRCNVSTSHSNYIFICPSIENEAAMINIELGKSASAICYKAGAQLADFKVDAGGIHEFRSKNCSLVDQLGRIFAKWNVQGVGVLKFENFSHKDFVLEKKQFDNVRVSNIKIIHMHRSNIVGIAADTFRNFASLEIISLKWNRITSLPNGFNLPSLRSLLLSTNNLSTLNKSFFEYMRSLNVLDLRYNYIKYLPEQLLYPLGQLEEVYLSDLVEIPNNFFKMNPVLKIVGFPFANLSAISEDVFANLSNLTILSITDSSLETLPENLLANQVNLHVLELQHNRLKTIPGNIFRNLQFLEILKLTGNQLQKWNSPVEQLPNLRYLNVASNHLTTIGTIFSDSMPNLRVLDLSRNKISHIAANAFKNLPLDLLDLGFNYLTSNESGTAFMNQMHSSELNLAYNNYTSVPLVLESSTRNLNMSYNKIKTINILLAADCDFSHNEIERISLLLSDRYKTSQTLGSKTSKRRIKLGDNPFDCGCDAFPLVQYFGNSYSNENIYQKISLDGLQCHSPPNLARRNVNSLKSQTFTCNYKENACPRGCSCDLHPYYKSFNITCNNRNLTTPPPVPKFIPKTYKDFTGFQSIFTINKLVIDLSNNFIKRFTEKDSSYVNASDLYLSYNELNRIDWLPPRLESLRLDGNKLENLDYKAILALNNSERLERLILRDNVWNCDCNLFNFTELVRAKRLMIPFANRILCTDGRKVMELSEDDLCNLSNQVLLTTIGACLFTLLVLLGLAAILYKKYEYHVKIWIYNNPTLQRFVTEYDLDKDKLYDAFVSYSHEDEEFVAKELVSILEAGANPYKLCVHVRDWVVGEFICKQITESVEKSRRTIIVLSPHFLESEWATMEFRVAHHQAMKESRHRVIVILYGDIDPKSIEDEDLRVYLSTNTYEGYPDINKEWTPPVHYH